MKQVESYSPREQRMVWVTGKPWVTVLKSVAILCLDLVHLAFPEQLLEAARTGLPPLAWLP